MGFKKVYKALQEIFPDVDSRALRAVAIEHSKDADIAVEVVLTEVIPFLTEKSKFSSSSSERSMVKPYEVDPDAIARGENALPMNATLLDKEENGSSSHDAVARRHPSLLDASDGYYQLLTKDNSDHFEVNGECASGETVLSEMSEETDTEGLSLHTSDFTTSTEDAASSHMNNSLHASIGESYEAFGLGIVAEVPEDSNEENSDTTLGQAASSNVQDITLMTESSGELIVVPDMLTTEPGSSINTATKEDTLGETGDIENDSVLNSVVTRSGQICSIDLLEGIIADAESNKKTLLSAMESMISLMREVELQEKAAEEAKEAAAKGGLDILSRVEDLKKMLQHAKEANDMHAGEVYGERAILATEVRELQSRLLSLSEDKDKSIEVLDEMHQTLVSRLEAAEKERKVAENEKLEKEGSAHKALAEQESIMEKVVQEADMLKQAAAENAKLQEFLVDRGRVVDMLQGEISVICQDVRLLKEKFDERVLFSKSLSSSQTSVILASSSCFLKSLTTDQFMDQMRAQSDSSEDQKLSDSIACPNEQQVSGGKTAGDDHKALVDEGWEIFENGDYV